VKRCVMDPWAPGCERLKPRRREEVAGLVVHRIEVSQEDATYGDTPEEVARFFREHPIGVKATGGDMPYPILIAPDGTVTQTLPLGLIAPHAVKWNPTTVGVGCIGDFRGRAPAAAQRTSLVEVCAALLRDLGCGVDAMHGHDELSGGSHDPNKECPGRCLPLEELRRDVAALLARDVSLPPFVW
jgi:hypothetical protein